MKTKEKTYIILTNNDGLPYILCLKCNMKSYHPRDVSEKYCGNCHIFHEG